MTDKKLRGNIIDLCCLIIGICLYLSPIIFWLYDWRIGLGVTLIEVAGIAFMLAWKLTNDGNKEEAYERFSECVGTAKADKRGLGV